MWHRENNGVIFSCLKTLRMFNGNFTLRESQDFSGWNRNLACKQCFVNCLVENSFMVVKLIIIWIVDAVFVYLGLHVPWRKVENGCFKNCFVYPYKNKTILGNKLEDLKSRSLLLLDRGLWGLRLGEKNILWRIEIFRCNMVIVT